MTMHESSRREFLAVAAVAATVAISARAQDPPQVAQPAGKYVDVHTHLGQPWGDRPALTAAGLLAWMDARGIAQAVVLPLISPEAWDHPLTTDYVLRETEPHRDRLIPFCSIDPRTINLSGYAAKRDLLRRYQDAGAKGFGEHKAGVTMDDPRNLELFRACGELGLPILFHVDNHRNMDAPGLPGLETVLREVSNATFIAHANGWWASISADATQEHLESYPKGKVVPGGAIDVLMDKYPNIYGDLSAGSGANAIARDIEFGREFLIRRADRLIFGTDYLAPEQAVPQFELLDSLALPDDVQAKIYRDNARRILNL
jgi:predicted TIM-barrel fold metal-dependent hydrolase